MTLWLTAALGAAAADAIVGGMLVVVGALVFIFIHVSRPRGNADARAPLGLFDNLTNLSMRELRGLALIFENHPLLASALALYLGVEKGVSQNTRGPQ